MSKQRRISDYGIEIGELDTGKLNKISDVKGVKVGHFTIDTDIYKTGATIISPSEKNIYLDKLIASSYVLNGYGKTTGLIQLDELGQLESPIALTNTLNVGLVQDALLGYMIKKTAQEGVDISSINTVVAECNDSYLNKITDRIVRNKHLISALKNTTINFKEGDIGAGKGMSCHQLKGGIGSASRIFKLDNITYTMGVLVLSNHGILRDLLIRGKNIGKLIEGNIQLKREKDEGSIIIIVATDLPLSSRQIKRICKRTSIGMARTGSFMGHGSGEIIIGFSTANIINNKKAESEKCSILNFKFLNEDKIDIAFRAVAEATEEAILNSMITAGDISGYKKHKRISLKNYMYLLE